MSIIAPKESGEETRDSGKRLKTNAAVCYRADFKRVVQLHGFNNVQSYELFGTEVTLNTGFNLCEPQIPLAWVDARLESAAIDWLFKHF